MTIFPKGLYLMITFAAQGHYSSLWPQSTTYEKFSVRLFVVRGLQNVVVSKDQITKKEMLDTDATGRRQTLCLIDSEMY